MKWCVAKSDQFMPDWIIGSVFDDLIVVWCDENNQPISILSLPEAFAVEQQEEPPQ